MELNSINTDGEELLIHLTSIWQAGSKASTAFKYQDSGIAMCTGCHNNVHVQKWISSHSSTQKNSWL